MSVVEARDIVIVHGPQAATYLQGQLSQAVIDLEVGASRWSFLLEPSGKLGHLVRVHRRDDEAFALDVEAGRGDAVEARLRRFFMRTKAEFTRSTMTVAIDGSGEGAALIGWGPGRTHRVTDGPASASDVLDAARLASSWPGAPELTEGLIPGETLLVPVTVAFDKGCYTGQELVARIDSRGNNVPKLLRRIELAGEAMAGDQLAIDGEDVAELTTVSGNLAFAYVPRRFEPPLAASVNGVAAQVTDLG